VSDAIYLALRMMSVYDMTGSNLAQGSKI
jgi:hypothetical protein